MYILYYLYSRDKVLGAEKQTQAVKLAREKCISSYSHCDVMLVYIF